MGRNSTTFYKSKQTKNVLVRTFTAYSTAAALLFFCNSPVSNAKKLLDRIVAEVNSRPILDSEIRNKVHKGPLIKISPYPAGDNADQYQLALEDSINFKLVRDHADYLNIEVEDQEIKTQINRILEQNNININQLKEFLLQQGKEFQSYQDDMFDQILLMKFKRQVLMPLVKLTDSDVRSYYLSKVGGSEGAVTLSLRKIYLSLPEKNEKTKLLEKENLAEKIYQEIKSGIKFIDAEKKYSEHSDARDGKPALSMKLAEMDTELASQLKNINEGDLTKPFKWNQGIFIFFVEKKMFSESKDYLEQKDKLEFELMQMKTTAQMNLWLKKQREQAKIRIIAE